MPFETIKLPENQLIKEASRSNYDRYSHPAFTRKIAKGIMLCDYDKSEKLIECEIDGNKYWVPIVHFFGKVIAEAKEILYLFPSGGTCKLEIVGVEELKVNRTYYWKLIFELELPF